MRYYSFLLLALALLGSGCRLQYHGTFSVQLSSPLPAMEPGTNQLATAIAQHAELQQLFVTAHDALRSEARKFESPAPDLQRYTFDEWGDSRIDLRYVAKKNRVDAALVAPWVEADDQRSRWKLVFGNLRLQMEKQFGVGRVTESPLFQ